MRFLLSFIVAGLLCGCGNQGQPDRVRPVRSVTAATIAAVGI
jgi:hypothetical protein